MVFNKIFKSKLYDYTDKVSKENQLAELVQWSAVQTADSEGRGSNPTRSGSWNGGGAERAGAVDGGGNCHGGGGMLLSCYQTQKMALKIHFF